MRNTSIFQFNFIKLIPPPQKSYKDSFSSKSPFHAHFPSRLNNQKPTVLPVDQTCLLWLINGCCYYLVFRLTNLDLPVKIRYGIFLSYFWRVISTFCETYLFDFRYPRQPSPSYLQERVNLFTACLKSQTTIKWLSSTSLGRRENLWRRVIYSHAGYPGGRVHVSSYKDFGAPKTSSQD